MDGGNAISGASATPTYNYGGNNSTTNFDDQAENPLVILQSNGGSPPDYGNGGASFQGGHKRRDTRIPFPCPDCAASHPGFTRERDMRRHIKSFHGNKHYTCDICRKKFSRKDSLNRHKRTHN